MEFYSQNVFFSHAKKGISEFHSSFFFTAFKDNVWTLAKLFKNRLKFWHYAFWQRLKKCHEIGWWFYVRKDFSGLQIAGNCTRNPIVGKNWWLL